ncbi:MAG: flagellar motor switch protein FliN [Desulfobacterales bacterium C00003104]|nr:MAG: flagellar motor switch protein FliN [Desulfobacterales bacterium C00003104]
MSQEERGKPEKARPIDFILDIPLGISVELGRTRMVVNDLLQLGPGSIVELNKSAGEPMEILINNKLVARGEVIVVNEKLAVRLTDIVSPIERIESFK